VLLAGVQGLKETGFPSGTCGNDEDGLSFFVMTLRVTEVNSKYQWTMFEIPAIQY
jgi:hypothetical protein